MSSIDEKDSGARISWRRHRQLARAGRTDGATAQPGVDGTEPVTSEYRSMLTALSYAAVADVWEQYFTSHAIRAGELTELRARLADLRAQASRAVDTHRRARDDALDPTRVTASPGELAHGRSPDDVLARRRRAHRRTVAEHAARVQAADEAVAAIEQQVARLESVDAADRRRAAHQEYELLTVCTAERSVYDRALLRRHRDRHVLQHLLDHRPPQLSGWAAQTFDPKEKCA